MFWETKEKADTTPEPQKNPASKRASTLLLAVKISEYQDWSFPVYLDRASSASKKLSHFVIPSVCDNKKGTFSLIVTPDLLMPGGVKCVK